jgi:hypothetical protein
MRTTTPLISCVINCDTRSGFQENNTVANGLFNGCVSEDFLTDGVYNKIKFLRDWDAEIILFIDEHNEVPENVLKYVRSVCDSVIIRKHSHEDKFNDRNYLSALAMARGRYVMHFDQDTNAFTSNKDYIGGLLTLAEQYDYVSYPSHWSPLPVCDETFDHVWASTRFFLCRRDVLDFTELYKCLDDYDYWCEKYPVNRKCNWLEHWLGSISKYRGKGVVYPQIELEKYTIFSWASYERWTLKRLNEQEYEDVIKFIQSKGGIQYPVDVKC